MCVFANGLNYVQSNYASTSHNQIEAEPSSNDHQDVDDDDDGRIHNKVWNKHNYLF